MKHPLHAAVARTPNAPFTWGVGEIGAPRAGEVLMRIAGVACATPT